MATTVSLKPNAVEISGSTSGTTTLQATAVAGTTTLTLPAATDTLVGKATTDTLTNKTLTGAVMNGTLGATTPSTVAATTLTTSSTITHNGGTANGVGYLDGSKVLTTGSALVFDGTNFSTTGSATVKNLLLSGGTLPGAGNPSIALRSSDNNIYFQSGSANQINFLDSAQNSMYVAAATLHSWNISNVAKMSINSSGVVTMNNYGAGTATFSAAGVISSVSDETWKIKDGVPVDPDSMLNKLEPGYWFYNDEKKESFGTDRQLGFYAQNVNAAIGNEAAPVPEKVKDHNGNDTDVSKPWGYYDRSVLAVVVMSLKNALSTIKEQQALITQLQADVALLKSAQ